MSSSYTFTNTGGTGVYSPWGSAREGQHQAPCRARGLCSACWSSCMCTDLPVTFLWVHVSGPWGALQRKCITPTLLLCKRPEVCCAFPCWSEFWCSCPDFRLTSGSSASPSTSSCLSLMQSAGVFVYCLHKSQKGSARHGCNPNPLGGWGRKTPSLPVAWAS